MKYRLISLFIVGFFFLSCDQNSTPKEPVSEKNSEINLPDTFQNKVLLISATDIIDLSSIPDTLSIRLINNTADTLTTGMQYGIEKKENKKWTNVLPEQEFQDIGFAIFPGDEKDFTIKLVKDKIKYDRGTYRLVKYYLKQDYYKTRQQFPLYVEFRIE